MILLKALWSLGDIVFGVFEGVVGVGSGIRVAGCFLGSKGNLT